MVNTDMAFHRSVVAASHNEILAGLFDDFVPRLRQSMTEMLRRRGHFGTDADQDAHARVLDAIVARDVAGTRALTRTHLLSLQEDLP